MKKLPEPMDWSRFFDDLDDLSGEPRLQQIKDPFTDEIVCPGLTVDVDGNIKRSNSGDDQ